MNGVVDLIRAGVTALQRRETALAADRVRRALTLAPDHGEAWNILGVVRTSGGDVVGAEPMFRRAVACAPGNPGAVRNLAECLKRQGRAAEARDRLSEAVGRGVLAPDLVTDLADLRLAEGEAPAAVPLHRLALQLAPDHARALNNMAEALTRAGRADDAAVALRRLAVLRNNASSWAAAGAALVGAGRQEEAAAALRRAAALDPAVAAEAASVWANLGFAHLDRHRAEAAEAAFLRALRLAPDLTEAEVGLGGARMLAGRLREGAASYEARLRLPQFQPPRRFDRPAWDGRVRAGATLLIHADRGLGDAIQFIRYAPLLRARGMRVVFLGPSGLLDLIRASGLVDAAHDYDGPLPDHDAHAHVLSLTHLMGTELDGIPADIPYLRAPEEAVGRWGGRLAGLPGLKVGLVWAGAAQFRYDRQRSPRLEPLLPLTTIPGASVVALQVGHGREDLERFPLPETALDLGAELRDFTDTAAVVAGLDVVVSSCTSMAHLAGAMGKPVAVLLHAGSEWRWLRERTDSPWYPTARLYRQTVAGDWSDPVERLRRDLTALAERNDPLQDRP
ncbi:tetratricopeptide repeat protein [Azospirillum sp. sgz302134]